MSLSPHLMLRSLTAEIARRMAIAMKKGADFAVNHGLIWGRRFNLAAEWCADVQALADGLGTWRELRDARRKVRP